MHVRSTKTMLCFKMSQGEKVMLTCHLWGSRYCKPRKWQPRARKEIHLKVPQSCTATGTSRIFTPLYSCVYKSYLGTKRPRDGADMRALRGARCRDRSPLSLQQKKNKKYCTLKILCNGTLSRKQTNQKTPHRSCQLLLLTEF